MNLTKFEWIITKLKRIFYEQFKSSGKLVNTGKRMWNSADRNTFSEFEKHKPKDMSWTAGSIPKNPRDSLVRLHPEGVSSNQGL